MIVDDHAAFRQALAVTLEHRAGFDVRAEAASPAEARRILQTLPGGLDLAIVDVDLPGRDTEALIRDLQEGPARAAVLGLTAARERAAGTPEAMLGTDASVDEILAVAGRLVG